MLYLPLSSIEHFYLRSNCFKDSCTLHIGIITVEHSSYVYDIKSIRKSNNVFIFAHKTGNIYETNEENYNKLLHENITKTYRKTANKIYKNINKEAKPIASNYEIAERIDYLPMADAFITLKDHKPNLTNNPKCRLTNP